MIGALFLALLVLGVPIALVLALSALAYIFTSGNTVLFVSFPQQLFGGMESYGLLAIPLFMLVGELMNAAGFTQRLIALASVFTSGVRGGLAYVNLLANMLMASIMGSAVAQIAMMSQVMVPEMERAGYRRDLASATTAAGGLLSPIIPPSMLFIIYGVIAQVPIGEMFIAGILPGLVLTGGFVLVLFVIGLFYPMPKGGGETGESRLRTLFRALPALSIPVAVVGGILSGLATPTESAAIAAAVAFSAGVANRQIRWRGLGPVLVRTSRNASMVVAIIACANVFGWVIIYEQIPQQIAAWITATAASAFTFMLLVNVLLLAVGMILDGIAALILVVPLLLPVAVQHYAISPIAFGVIVCLNLVLGLLTPPVGTGLYVAASAAEISPLRLFRALTPFLLVSVIVLLGLSYWPEVITLFV